MIIQIKDYDEREAAIAEFEHKMRYKPLTDEEERQKADTRIPPG